MSVVCFVETSIVIESHHGYEGLRDLDLLISKAAIDLIPVDMDQAYVARQAYRQYGKGRHAAALNFGNCFSYALTKALDEPLLFKSGDFSQTDIKPWH